MNNPSLDWLFKKDNPPKDKDNPSDVKLTSASDPKTVRFVSFPEIDQSPHSTTQSENENDDMLTKTAIMDNISLMEWTPDNDPPNNKDNSPNVKKSSISYAKIQKFVEHLTDNSPSTIHINNTDNSDNTDTFTPSPSTSHDTNNTSIAFVMTDCPNGWECPDRWASNDDIFNNADSTTTPSPSTITSTTKPSTKSQRNVLEQRKNRRHRKERDEKAKELEQKVHALQQ